MKESAKNIIIHSLRARARLPGKQIRHETHKEAVRENGGFWRAMKIRPADLEPELAAQIDERLCRGIAAQLLHA